MADLLERRWTLGTIYACSSGAARFNEFRQSLPGHLTDDALGPPRAARGGRDRANAGWSRAARRTPSTG